MGRLQGNGSLDEGVIPTRYKRIPCPTPGNAYAWLHDGGNPYYFATSIVNTAGIGSLAKLEVAMTGGSNWTALIRDPNYTNSRPQERYGAWTLPQGAGPLNPPLALRLTSPNGEVLVVEQAINSFMAPTTAPVGWNYIDLGVQFSQ